MSRRQFLANAASTLLATSAVAQESTSEVTPNSKSVFDQTHIVTGGTSGIGESCVRDWAAHGAKVVFCGRRQELGNQIQKEVRDAGGECLFLKCDITRPLEVENLVQTAVKTFGQIHGIFLNAGISVQSAPVHEANISDLAKLLETNVVGQVHCIKAILPHFMSKKKGCVVFNSSISSKKVFRGEAFYAASKAAHDPLMRHIATTYANYGIRSFAIDPYCVDTKMIQKRSAILGKALKNSLLNRTVNPVEVASLLRGILIADSALISGITFDLSAGQSHFMGRQPEDSSRSS